MFQDCGRQFKEAYYRTIKPFQAFGTHEETSKPFWIEPCLAEEAAAHPQEVFRAPAAVMTLEIWRDGFLLGICRPPTWKRRIWKNCSAHMGK